MGELSIKNRLNSKLEDLREYLEFLENKIPAELEDYKENEVIKAVCERYFEKIIEAVIDVGFLVVKLKDARVPLISESVFNVLAEEKIISLKLSEKLSDAKSMRNFIIHQYGGIDDEKIFLTIKEELIPDVGKFLEEVSKNGK